MIMDILLLEMLTIITEVIVIAAMVTMIIKIRIMLTIMNK